MVERVLGKRSHDDIAAINIKLLKNLKDLSDPDLEKGQEIIREIIHRNQGLVWDRALMVTKRALDAGISLDELIHEGNMGLVRAIEKFDLSRKTKFSTYARWWVGSKIGRLIENKEKENKGIVFSLEDWLGKEEGLTYGDVIRDKSDIEADFEEGVGSEIRRLAFNSACLSKDEKELIYKRFYLDYTFGEISKEIGITSGAAKQREHRIIKKLRQSLLLQKLEEMIQEK